MRSETGAYVPGVRVVTKTSTAPSPMTPNATGRWEDKRDFQFGVRSLRWKEFPSTAENDYRAEVIRYGKNLLYRARGVTVPIAECEAQRVVSNPFLYYFSTALKLDTRIKQVLGDRSTGRALERESERVRQPVRQPSLPHANWASSRPAGQSGLYTLGHHLLPGLSDQPFSGVHIILGTPGLRLEGVSINLPTRSSAMIWRQPIKRT